MDYADKEDATIGRWLEPRTAGRRAGVAVQTLANWRSKKIGPPYRKLSAGRGGRVRYDVFELDRWMSERADRRPQ